MPKSNTIKYLTLPTNYLSRLNNAQPHGVSRLTFYQNNLIINNLGKNLEFSKLNKNNSDYNLNSKYIYDFSFFSDLSTESEFDIDMHALLLNKNYLYALNHYGIIRIFAIDNSFKPIGLYKFASDTEYNYLVNKQILSSSSRSYAINDNNTAGLIVSHPIDDGKINYIEAKFTNIDELKESLDSLDFDIYLADLKQINIIFNESRLNLLGLACNNTFFLYKYILNPDFKLQNKVLEINLDYTIKYINIFNNCILLAGVSSPDSSIPYDDFFENTNDYISYFSLYDLSGNLLWHNECKEYIAWGYGGAPVVVRQNLIYVLLRNSGLAIINLTDGKCRFVSCVTDLDYNNENLGTGNLYYFNDKLLGTFNRAGYKLFCYEI